MNIISLRHVGSYEIPDSFRGILRISPNNLVDDPSALLTNTSLTEGIKLTDSSGNILPITFLPKKFNVTVDSRNSAIDLVNLSLKIDNLYISNSLNIKQTLYLSPSDNTPPIIFSDGNNAVGYPIEAPDNNHYFNNNNKFKFDKALSWSENINKIPPTADVYSDVDHWLKLNGEYVYNGVNHNGTFFRLPTLKRRNYALGARKVDKYNISSSNDAIHNIADLKKYQTSGTYTQLSYIPLETMLYTDIEGEIRGTYRSPIDGRYTKLNNIGHPTESNNTSDNLAKELFGDSLFSETSKTLETIIKKAPILGLGVQSGTIHYNAVPAYRYFFHLSRRYNNSDRAIHLFGDASNITTADPGLPSSINNITKQYVLCDGKNIASDYPAIDKIAFENSWSDTHKAMRSSIMNLNDDVKNFTTPPLFSCDQLSLRFLRGLNWLRSSKGEIYNSTDVLDERGIQSDKSPLTFIENNKKFIKISDNIDDVANHAKNIWKVGLYYASIDIKLQRNWKHSHLAFGNVKNEEISYENTKVDALNEYSNYFQGLKNYHYPIKNTGEYSSNWKTYVESWAVHPVSASPGKFEGSMILPTTGGLTKVGIILSGYEYIRNYPIIRNGGSSSYWWSVGGGRKHGTRKLGICTNHKHRWAHHGEVRDGAYNLGSSLDSLSDNAALAWRLVTSLPEHNRYDDITSPTSKKTRIKYYNKIGSTSERIIDDYLPSPSAVNFIPLMKI